MDGDQATRKERAEPASRNRPYARASRSQNSSSRSLSLFFFSCFLYHEQRVTRGRENALAVMLSFVRPAARQIPKHLAKAASFHAVKRIPGAARAFSDVPKTMTVCLERAWNCNTVACAPQKSCPSPRIDALTARHTRSKHTTVCLLSYARCSHHAPVHPCQ